MSRPGNRYPLGTLVRSFLVLLSVPIATDVGVRAEHDTVHLADGTQHQGRLLTVDAQKVLLELPDGTELPLLRQAVRRIDFGRASVPVIRARVKVMAADDEVTLKLDGIVIASPAEARAGWIDLAQRLADGANHLTAELRNTAGTWAYRWVLEAGSETRSFSCGMPGRSGCRRGGTTGLERGSFAAGGVWIYYHRETGELALQVDPDGER